MLPQLLLPARSFSSEDATQKYEKLQGEIKQKEEKLNKASKREHSILGEIETIEKSLASLEADLRAKRSRLRQTQSQIVQTQAEMAKTESDLRVRREWLKSRLRAMQRQGSSEELAMLLGSGDMASFLRRWRYLTVIAGRDKKMLDQYRGALKELQEKQQMLDGLYADLKRQEEEEARSESRLSAKRKEQHDLLASVRSEKDEYNRMLRELKAASEELSAVIKRSARTDDYAGIKGFRGLKGRLPWPVQGTIAFQYGRQLDPKFNTPIFRNGIYIKTAADVPVRAVYTGKVVFADWFKGYGQLVIINHGEGYHTLYADLNEIFLKVGDIIDGKGSVGRVGESAAVNGPTLYFELRYKGKPLNPLQWLGRN
jgi:septal ring factor EnvC (AmiA/AmiB activator)